MRRGPTLRCAQRPRSTSLAARQSTVPRSNPRSRPSGVCAAQVALHSNPGDASPIAFDRICVVVATAACAGMQQLSGLHEGLRLNAFWWAGSPPLGMASWTSSQHMKQPSPGERLLMPLLLDVLLADQLGIAPQCRTPTPADHHGERFQKWTVMCCSGTGTRMAAQ